MVVVKTPFNGSMVVVFYNLTRLYPDYKPQIETAELKQDYGEMPELEQPDEGSLEAKQEPTQEG